MKTSEILKSLSIEGTNLGACGRGWITSKGAELESINPSTGEVIASVR